MQTTTAQPAPASLVEPYLERVRLALADVPPAERERLVDQARAEIDLELEIRHLEPSEASAVLIYKGSPEEFAQRLRSQAPLPVEEVEDGRLGPCRCCRREVAREALQCPHCGAPYPGKLQWRGWGYEYKSEKTLFGWPLVHVAFGRDSNGKMRVARGVIAVGQFGIGAITVAQFGVGLIAGLGQFVVAPIAVGQIAGGLVAVGQFAIGLLFGAGMVATGLVAKGMVALGNFLGR